MSADTYLPIPWDFREVLEEVMQQDRSGRIHYFSKAPLIERAEGRITSLVKDASGEYLVTDRREKVRLDKIITLFGRPGPAFDEYESYGNACMNCHDDSQDQ